MESKKVLLCGIFALAIIVVSLGFVSAAYVAGGGVRIINGTSGFNVINNGSAHVNFSVAGSGQNSSNSILINVTFRNGSAYGFTAPNTLNNANINVTFYANLSNGTWVKIGNSSTCVLHGAEANFGTCFGNITVNGTSGYDVSSLFGSEGIFSINATVTNGTDNATILSFANLSNAVVIDNKQPQVSLGSWASPVGAGKNFTGNLVFNISVNDSGIGIQSVVLNISNGTAALQNYTVVMTAEGTPTQGSSTPIRYAVSISTSEYIDGRYNISIIANDSLNNINSTTIFSWGLLFDNTVPAGTVTCTPSTVSSGSTITCTCSGTDGTSGVNSTSITANPSTSNTGSHTSSCIVIDTAGNANTISGTYNVELTGGGSPSGSSSSSSSSTSATPSTTVAKTTVTLQAGESTILSEGLGSAYGLKSVEVKVSGASEDVKITVNKYDSRPAAVSVEKAGEVYKYLEINVENVEDKLDKGTITMQVLKSWVSSNDLSKEDIAMYKFSNGEWKELTTTFVEEEGNNYIYSVEVDSFSYFAIGDRTEQAIATTQAPEEEAGIGTAMWIGIIVVALILVLLILWLMKKK